MPKYYSRAGVDPPAPTFQLCLQFAGFQIKCEGVSYHLTLIFLQSWQITLKDVIFPCDVIRAHIALSFYWSPAKESTGTGKKYCFFSASNSPFHSHSECMCIQDTAIQLVDKATGLKPKFHSHLHCFLNYRASTSLLEVSRYPLTFTIYIHH